MKGSEYREKIASLQNLVWLQIGVRMLVRSTWLALSGILAGWGLNALAGWPPGPLAWLAIGLGLGLLPLAHLANTWIKQTDLAWRLDRLFGLKEQLSTALQEVERGDPSPITLELIDQAGRLAQETHGRIRRRGWFLEREGLSLAIVLALGATVLANSALSHGAAGPIPPAQAVALPPLPAEPGASEVFSEDLPPDGENAANSLTQSPVTSLRPEDLQALIQAAQAMGSSLSANPDSSQLSKALEEVDLEKAARELTKLVDHTSGLSEDLRNDLSEAMKRGAEKLAGSRLDELAQDLQEAQKALEKPLIPVTGKDALSSLADDLEQLGGQIANAGELDLPGSERGGGGEQTPANGSEAGSIPGVRERGEAQNLERLAGEGDILDLTTEEDMQKPGVLEPGKPGVPGETTVQGGLNAADPNNFTGDRNSIVPFTFPWAWKDVVSQYFQPPR